MNNKTKIWLILGFSLMLVGCIVFGCVMTVLKWDFTKLSTVRFETNDYDVKEDFKNISIVTDTADILFVSSENDSVSVHCYEQKSVKHSVSVKDGALIIEVNDTRKWYEHIGIMFGTPKITVSVPQGEYGLLTIKSSTGDVEISKDFQFESMDISESTGDVTSLASAAEEIKIKTSTGNILIENISANALDLSVSTGSVTASGITCQGDVKINVSTGKVNITDADCKNVISGGNTGDITLKNVTATEMFSIERTTGNVKLDVCDAAEIWIQTHTGDVTGILLTDKVFLAQTDTGSIDVPQTASGGKCQIRTDTGDIKVTVQ